MVKFKGIKERMGKRKSRGLSDYPLLCLLLLAGCVFVCMRETERKEREGVCVCVCVCV